MTKETKDIGTRDPLMVANYLLSKRMDRNHLTPLQLLKLVYIAHGWFLAFFDKPLIREHVQAWKYGPVIPSLYHAIKHYGKSPIKELLEGADDFEKLDDKEKKILDETLRIYGKFDGVQLSSLTHQRGTPWSKVWKGNFFEDIPNDMIKEYYLEKKNGK